MLTNLRVDPHFASQVGAVSQKNINNIIIKGTLDILVCAIMFWAIGFAIAFGGGAPGSFIGGEGYFFGSCLDGFPETGYAPDTTSTACANFGMRYHEWFFQFAFAAAAATIVSGAVAERTTTACYLVYSGLLTAFVYPVIVHWQWGGGLTANLGAVDYAGSGVVHMTGGLAAIIGAAIIGPRKGRFTGTICKVTVHELPSYSVVFSTIGVILLWFGWYGFNTGSTLGITWVTEGTGAGPSEAGLVILNTTLCPAAAGLTAMIVHGLGYKKKTGKFILQLNPVLNGILAGLVSITAGCGDVRPWCAVIMGIIGGMIYEGSSKLQKMLKIDDVVDAGPVHFWCGMWGVVALALFADDHGTGLTGPGLFYGGGADLLGANILLIINIWWWVAVTMIPTFGVMKALGVARVSSSIEEVGMDASKHGVTPVGDVTMGTMA